MSTLDDARTLVQDIVVPDLKALSARVDALERSMKQSFEASDKITQQRLEAIEQRVLGAQNLADARHEMLLIKMQVGFNSMDAKFAAADTRFDSILKAINIDRRLELPEAAQAKLLAGDERHA